MTDRWHWATHRGTAQALHDLVPPAPWVRRAWRLDAISQALVLGSTQPASTVAVDGAVDSELAAAGGMAVARRRSGGGVVLVGPDDTVWIDVFVPSDDPLHDDDVGRATHWLGETWREALTSLGLDGLAVHVGAMVHGPDARLVCFAGRGPGEVFAGDAKVVGISQRRTRDGARFQCAVPLRWEPDRWASLLRPAPVTDLASVAHPVGHDADTVVAAFRDALTRR